MYKTDKTIQRLFIHVSSQVTKAHNCQVYSYNVANQKIKGIVGPSASTTVVEHGWVRDLDIIRQICANHSTPNGEKSQIESFSIWRDSLLAFLDTYHSRTLWIQIDESLE